MLDSVFNPILLPLFKLGPLFMILIVSLIVSLVITFVYKWMTDQDLMKTLKGDVKSMQKEMKQLKDNPEKMMKMQKKAMEKNMKYMMHSLKPTLVTFIPLILIFGWLNAHMAFDPINPNEPFTTTIWMDEDIYGDVTLSAVPNGLSIQGNATQEIVKERATWILKGDAGEYSMDYEYKGRHYDMDVLITDEQLYGEPIKKVKDDIVVKTEIGYEKIIVMNLFGWKLGWLGTYIIFSLIFSLGLRKILKIH